MAEKKLRRKTLPLSPLSEIEGFLEEFKSALNRGEFDPYLFEFIEAIDGRVTEQFNDFTEEPDAYVAAFLRQVRHLRVAPPQLEPEACYELLGARYSGVVVRYIETYEGKARVEVVKNSVINELVPGNVYRIPLAAIDRQVPEPEGK
jgi:hypothetical protein